MIRNTNTLNRIARYCTPRILLPVALVLLLADLTITIALVGLAHELNPVAVWLYTTLGWTGVGLLAVGAVALSFFVAERAPERIARAAAVVLTLVMAVPVVWNLHVFVTLGMPELLWMNAIETVAPAAVVAGVAAFRRELATVGRVASGPFSSRQWRAVALALLMVLWLPAGVSFVGTQPVDDGSGTALGDETEYDYIVTVDDDGFANAYDPESFDNIWTNELTAGSYRGEMMVTDGVHAYTQSNDILFKLDMSDGSEIWSTSISATVIRGKSLRGRKRANRR